MDKIKLVIVYKTGEIRIHEEVTDALIESLSSSGDVKEWYIRTA